MSHLAGQYERVLKFRQGASQPSFLIKDVADIGSAYLHSMLVADLPGDVEGFRVHLLARYQIPLLHIDHTNVSEFSSCGFLVAVCRANPRACSYNLLACSKSPWLMGTSAIACSAPDSPAKSAASWKIRRASSQAAVAAGACPRLAKARH